MQGHEGHDDAVDLLRDDLAQELGAVEPILIGDQHQCAALGERGEDLLEADVEADGRELQRPIAFLQYRGPQLPLDQIGEWRMVHGDTLGPAGAAAGEEHVEQVLGRSWRGPFEGRSVCEVDVLDQEHFGCRALEQVLVRFAGYYNRRLGILQHAGDALGGVGGVDGGVRGTCTECG